jgi:hypothetical protein
LAMGKILLWLWCPPWERSRSAPSRTLARSKLYPASCRACPRLTADSCSLASGSVCLRIGPVSGTFRTRCGLPLYEDLPLFDWEFYPWWYFCGSWCGEVYSASKTAYTSWHLWWFQTFTVFISL